MSETALQRCMEFATALEEAKALADAITSEMDVLRNEMAVEALHAMRSSYENNPGPYLEPAESRALVDTALGAEDKIRRITECAREVELVGQMIRGSITEFGNVIADVHSSGEYAGMDAWVAVRKVEEKVIILEDRLKRRGDHPLSNPQVRKQVWDMTGGHCFYCREELTEYRDPDKPDRCFHIDHIVPKASGGPDHVANFVPSCAGCNTAKSSTPFIEFVQLRAVAVADAMMEAAQ